jgi:rubrerythrin
MSGEKMTKKRSTSPGKSKKGKTEKRSAKDSVGKELDEGVELCPDCGSRLVWEDGEKVCPNCDTKIDFFGDEDERKHA